MTNCCLFEGCTRWRYCCVLGCCLREIPIIILLQTTCTICTSDVPEPHCGHACHIASERFRFVVCEIIDVIYCGICRPAFTPHYMYLTSDIKNASLRIFFYFCCSIFNPLERQEEIFHLSAFCL